MVLNTASGKAVFPIGIGTWGMGGTWKKVIGNENVCIEAIQYSLLKGQNLIDSGEVYGEGYTDEIIGQAIEKVKREDIYLTDKLWENSVATGKVSAAVEKMLSKLQTNYLDMLYIHKPWDDWPWKDAIPQIDNLIDLGVVRSIGVSNFNLEQLKETIKLSRHPVVANQLLLNLSDRRSMQRSMINFCKDNNIQIITYRPLAKGALATSPVLQSIAKKRNLSAAQISLAWLLQQGFLVVTKSVQKKYIAENISSVKTELSKADIDRLTNLTEFDV